MAKVVHGLCAPLLLDFGLVALGDTLCKWLNVVVDKEPAKDGDVSVTGLPSDCAIDSIVLPSGCTKNADNSVHVPKGVGRITIQFEICWTPLFVTRSLTASLTISCSNDPQGPLLVPLSGHCTSPAAAHVVHNVEAFTIGFLQWASLRRFWHRPLPPDPPPPERVFDQTSSQI